jgi:hypothetical protein
MYKQYIYTYIIKIRVGGRSAISPQPAGPLRSALCSSIELLGRSGPRLWHLCRPSPRSSASARVIHRYAAFMPCEFSPPRAPVALSTLCRSSLMNTFTTFSFFLARLGRASGLGLCSSPVHQIITTVPRSSVGHGSVAVATFGIAHWVGPSRTYVLSFFG